MFLVFLAFSEGFPVAPYGLTQLGEIFWDDWAGGWALVLDVCGLGSHIFY